MTRSGAELEEARHFPLLGDKPGDAGAPESGINVIKYGDGGGKHALLFWRRIIIRWSLCDFRDTNLPAAL